MLARFPIVSSAFARSRSTRTLARQSSIARTHPGAIAVTLVAAALSVACAGGEKATEVTPDGLQLLPGSRLQRAYVKPGASFSQYKRVALLDCYVAFEKNWRMDHPDVRTRDMEQIKQALAAEFRKVFSEELEKGGYPIVSEPAEDVLLIRPAIIDLDVAAPDTMTSARAESFTTSAGSMTLYAEFYDSVSGEILARAMDRRQDSGAPGRGLTWTTRGSNLAAARDILRRWADVLVQRLDEIHGEKAG
jgi:hypothetical protein